ncbi:hypothetical protein ABZ826_13440 [Streptomyces sp. NPDC047515]|uniref:hypothetical protein n=1 Tax=Streptomyces sp. NPDC047515 TaxID=3155380 RepID=UPI003409CEDA
MAVTELHGRPHAITGSSDRTVRIWDLTTHSQATESRSVRTAWQVVANDGVENTPLLVRFPHAVVERLAFT